MCANIFSYVSSTLYVCAQTFTGYYLRYMQYVNQLVWWTITFTEWPWDSPSNICTGHEEWTTWAI